MPTFAVGDFGRTKKDKRDLSFMSFTVFWWVWEEIESARSLTLMESLKFH
jgi:hypothetical protein